MPLRRSKYDMVAPVGNDGSCLIANALTGTAHLLSAAEMETWRASSDDPSFGPEEEAQFRRRYLEFLDARDTDEVQLFYVPGYACNFDCDYCYQADYLQGGGGDQRPVIDALFDYVEHAFAGRRRYFTLFGGEPLLPGASARDAVTFFLAGATRRHTTTAVVTNGYFVEEYLDVLQDSFIREVQVTLDGTEDLHNRRRPRKDGGPTFEKIVRGVDQLLAARIPVNLRMVVDRDNLDNLPDLARFAIDRGWTADPLFKTQLGRNYELHACQHRATAILSRLELARELADIIAAHPHVMAFHAPSFHFVRTLARTGELPDPVFDSCPGCKTEWAFDHLGRIFSCTATVGKPGEELGTFFPVVQRDEAAIALWQDRDVLAIESCRSCAAALVCGGGCGAVARNTHGHLHSPDCRPVADIAAAGFPVYFEEDGRVRGKKEED